MKDGTCRSAVQNFRIKGDEESLCAPVSTDLARESESDFKRDKFVDFAIQ